MFFFSELWRYTKVGITTVGALLSIGMIVGGLIIGTGGAKGIIIIVGGSIFLVQSGILLFDNSKIQAKLKGHINELEDNIDKFESQNMLNRANIKKFTDENKKLVGSLKRSEEQLQKLSNIKDEYNQANIKYNELLKRSENELEVRETQVKIYQSENVELKNSLEKMQTLQTQFQSEIDKYKNLMAENNKHLQELESVKNDYIEENEKLQQTNLHNQEQLQVLQNQVSKLKELYSNSLELLNNLRQAGDVFTNFNESIGDSITKIESSANSLDTTQTNLDETVGIFQSLIEKLKQSTFQKLDKNQDGKVTQEEFDENLPNL